MKRNMAIIGLAAVLCVSAANADTYLRIKCEDEDVGAVVFINDREVGACPVDAPAPAGMVVVRARLPVGSEQEKLFSKEIKVIEGVPQRVDIVMSPPQISAEAIRMRQVAEAKRDLLGAEAGDVGAMRRTAEHYSVGYGVEKNAAKAQEWSDKLEVALTKDMERRARGGDTDYMKKLAERYEQGLGVARDPAMAQEWRDKREVAITQYWLRRATNNGSTADMLILADRYDKGLGVPRDPVIAQEWQAKADVSYVQLLQRNAGSGSTEAMKTLADYYEKGRGVEKDMAQAQAWRERYQQALQEKQNQRYRPAMVVIPAGQFEMGADDREYYKPVHTVTVPSFMMAKTEVTQAQWLAVMGNNPSQFRLKGYEANPVEMVSWDDIQSYLNKLNALTGQQYRLPTEAEWEYACRAGGTHTYCGGDTIGTIAWTLVNSRRDEDWSSSHPVAQKQANAFGLYDMSGNILEYVQDCWNDSYGGFFQSAPTDGRAWMAGDCDKRVVRGGSWNHHDGYAWSPYRGYNGISSRYNNTGFRIARSLP